MYLFIIYKCKIYIGIKSYIMFNIKYLHKTC